MTKPLRVALAGIGTVGGAVARYILGSGAEKGLILSAVSARNRARDRGLDLGEIPWYDDPVDMAATADVDVFVELIGGASDVASLAVRGALSRGCPVVTANKALLAESGAEIAAIAERCRVSLAFEAAIGAGIPIVNVLSGSLQADTIHRVQGILNGTCNFILSTMDADQIEFEAALQCAQEAGFAEADPTLDIDGWDTAHKIRLLACLAFGVSPSIGGVFVEGIRDITLVDLASAKILGYRIKLLGIAHRVGNRVDVRVQPVLISQGSPLARIDGPDNAVVVDADLAGPLLFSGAGAGAQATASAVLSDMLAVKYSLAPRYPFLRSVSRFEAVETPGAPAPLQAYFCRARVRDESGSLEAVARELAAQGISLDGIEQGRFDSDICKNRSEIPTEPGYRVIVITTHRTTRDRVSQAMRSIGRSGIVSGPTLVIPIENGAVGM